MKTVAWHTQRTLEKKYTWNEIIQAKNPAQTLYCKEKDPLRQKIIREGGDYLTRLLQVNIGCFPQSQK